MASGFWVAGQNDGQIGLEAVLRAVLRYFGWSCLAWNARFEDDEPDRIAAF
jgi:hypothetical protein